MSIISPLLDHQAVRISLDPPFTWSSGILSPVYCDNRLMTSFVEARNEIVEGFVNKIQELDLKPEAIGGTATAGISWAAFVAQRLNLPMFYVRPKPKGHGAGKQVEGVVPENSKILIVEDLISTGGSSIKSAEACQREFNADVLGIMAIFTYELALAEKNFAESGLKAYPLATFPELLNEMKSRGDISEAEERIVLKFREDPKAWGESL